VEPASRLRPPVRGHAVLVPVAPFALLIFYALGAEDAFVTSFQWHVLVLVTSGLAVVAVVCALLDDTGGVRAVVRKPAGLVLLVSWLVLVAGAGIAVSRIGGDSRTSASPPRALGELGVGKVLRAHPGRWVSAAPLDEMSYAWERCSSDCEVVAPFNAGRQVQASPLGRRRKGARVRDRAHVLVGVGEGLFRPHAGGAGIARRANVPAALG
jgi:hypothetical protein